ncbi:MAG: YdcF family protein [Clostridiales bacterium]|nr:YdcF family protein [Clostridiales bacterium]
MYTRWRLYILAVFLIVIGVLLFCCRVWRKRGHSFSALREAFLILGVVLIVETLIVSTLSNYNLGVILPAFFGVPLVFLALVLPKMDKGFLRFLKWLIAACYAVAIGIFLVCGFLMIRASSAGEHVEADAVIVLGAAVHGDKVTWVLENRLNTAADYLEAHTNAVCVVSGGQGAGETVTEASAMKLYLVERGIDAGRIYTEEQAKNTKENFEFSKAIIDEAVGKDARIAFVTTNFHVYRAGQVAKAQGVDAVGIPAEDVWYLRLNNFLRECVGICVYALRGDI